MSVSDWIARGGSVCPFATLAHRDGQVRYVQLRRERIQAQAWVAARAFIERRGQALVLLLPRPDPPTWDAGRAAVWALWREMAVAVARINFPLYPVEALRRRLAQDAVVADRRGMRQIIQLLADGKVRPLFATGMGPQYPREHPRWAPHTLISLTWMHDVDRAREATALHRRVQARMTSYCGGLYDADELWLDIMPAVTGQPEE